VNIGSDDAVSTPAGRAAATTIFRQMRYHEDKLLSEFVEGGMDVLPSEWQEAAAVAVMNSRLTADQLREFVVAVMQLMDEYVLPYKNQNVPGSRPVHVAFNAFPVIDGDAVPEENAN
jgi:hypothetical protein